MKLVFPKISLYSPKEGPQTKHTSFHKPNINGVYGLGGVLIGCHIWRQSQSHISTLVRYGCASAVLLFCTYTIISSQGRSWVVLNTQDLDVSQHAVECHI